MGIAALSVGARLKERRGGGGGGRGEENLNCPISSSLLGVCLLVEGRGSRVEGKWSRVEGN